MSLCGAWSVAIMSIVPSFRASISESTSDEVLRGGLTLALVSYESFDITKS